MCIILAFFGKISKIGSWLYIKYIDEYIREQEKPIAFVLNIGMTGLGVIRSLGRRGIPVVGLGPISKQTGHYSKYCVSIVCPDPVKDEEGYINLLINLGKNLKTKGVLIPTADADVLAISKHRSKLENYYHISMPICGVIGKMVNKKEFHKSILKLNIPQPKTYLPESISELKHASSELTYPCIIKPAFSFKNNLGAKVLKINSKEQLIESYNKAASCSQELVIQEVIPGDDSNIYGLGSFCNCNSELKGMFVYRKKRGYPKGFGTCSFVESVYEPEVIDLGRKILREFGYYGISEIEFKRDPRDNQLKIIEINARTWAENSLADRCGVDLSYMMYMDALSKDVDESICKKEGVKWVFMFDDLRSSIQSIRNKELTLDEYLKSLYGEIVFAIFAWDDPYPFLFHIFELSREGWKRSVKRLSLIAKKDQGVKNLRDSVLE